jgi:hypothetical protein
VGVRHVYKLLKAGLISVNENNKIDYAVAKKAMEDAADPRRQRKANIDVEESRISYAELQRINIELKNKILDLEIREKEGELVKYDDIKNKVFSYARIFRDTMLTLPDRLSPILAAEQDRNKIHNILSTEIRNALEESAKNAI